MVSVCDGAPWGPWEYGMFTDCFLHVVLAPIFTFVIIVGFLHRLITLRHASLDTPYGKFNATKITLSVILMLTYVFTFLAHLIISKWLWFQLFGDLCEVVVWGFCVAVMRAEMKSNHLHSWAIRLCFAVKFIFVVFVLQALWSQPSGFEYYQFDHTFDVFVALIRLCLITILTIFSFFVKGGKIDLGYEVLADRKPTSYGTLETEGSKKSWYEEANIFSKAIFSWSSHVAYTALRGTIEHEDLGELPAHDEINTCVDSLEREWSNQQLQQKPSFGKAIFHVHRRLLILSGLARLLHDIVALVGPIATRMIIAFVDSSQRTSVGLTWVLVIFVAYVTQSLLSNYSVFVTARIANMVSSATTALVYRKITKISATQNQTFTTGQIMSFVSVDTRRVAYLFPRIHNIWAAPLQVIWVLYLLWGIIGPSMLAGLAVILVGIPLTAKSAMMQTQAVKSLQTARDARNHLLSEMLLGMRLVKFFNWENWFYDRINVVRKDELKHETGTLYHRAAILFFTNVAPFWIAAFSFLSYMLLGNVLTPDVAFTTLLLFNVIRMPLGFLPMAVTGLMEYTLSLERVQQFLVAEELDARAIEKYDVSGAAVKVENGTFTWDTEGNTPALRDINFQIMPNELIAVVGPVGSGKSSLLAALLGEIPKLAGRVCVDGNIAYVSQQAWLKNATLRDNILFGRPYNEDRYNRCVRCCELLPDILALPEGDSTEIGEKGINLSGGQKQRISLARAMYQTAAIYLLDSPLSAVDAHVGAAIFENLISNELANTTRILVTHNLDILHRVDRIIVLREGAIEEIGTYDELMEKDLDFAQMITKHVGENGQGKQEPEPKQLKQMPEKSKKPEGSGKLIVAETRGTGSVGWAIYKQYIAASGVAFAIAVALLTVVVGVAKIVIDMWLVVWTADQLSKSEAFYVSIFIAFACINSVLFIVRIIINIFAAVKASTVMHNTMLTKVMHAPMYFFDSVPLGRIMNRFVQDFTSIDHDLSFAVLLNLNTAISLILASLMICYITPLFLLPLLPLSVLFWGVLIQFIRASSQGQRIIAINTSPVYAIFSETITGKEIIRAFSVSQDFIAATDERIKAVMKATFAYNGIERWATIRIEIWSNVAVMCTALFCVLQRETMTSALAGLALYYAVQLLATCTSLLQFSSPLMNSVVAVERVVEYSNIEQEAPHDFGASVPFGWPQAGEIHFDNLHLKYRPNLDFVLRGIDEHIKPREKIGIVGRTGAGKSSLFLALLRTTEPASGTIRIDNIDITKIGLSILRSSIAIIPQDPTLFQGTIRTNLDPHGAYDDAKIWAALESVHMKNALANLPDKLNSKVDEYGGNFSVGERQLLCLSRAMLKNAKILLIDEATASVDLETDALIQQTIKEKFADCTVLTIAHRIHTIMDYDRVFVMDAGKVVESGIPELLCSDRTTIFHSLWREATNNDNKVPL